MTTPRRNRSLDTRLNRAVDHIEAHMDGELALEAISRAAASSKHHFHRGFRARLGVTPVGFVRLARLKRAAYRLAFRSTASVTAIALDAGYASSDAFARAFRRTFRQSPRDFRRAPDWARCTEVWDRLDDVRRRAVPALSAAGIDIVDVPRTPVAILAADPQRPLGDALRDFIAWRRENGVRPPASATFNILRPDGGVDLCAATDRSVGANPYGVTAGCIPALTCARLTCVGGDHALRAVLDRLLTHWLPGSGYAASGHPPFLRRLRFFPEVPESQAESVLYLPLVPSSRP